MSERIYENCASPKAIFIVKGAGHAESYYKEKQQYERKVDDFIKRYLSDKEVKINV